jgi:hypothetical protein
MIFNIWALAFSQLSINANTHKAMKNLTVETKSCHVFDPSDINDLVSTALEGGINYWCGEAIIKLNPDKTYFGVDPKDADKVQFASDVISVGGTLILHDAESEDKWELTLDKMLQGIKMFCEHNGKSPENLMDDYDAGDADCIMQYAVMGEIVFG